MVKVTTKCRQIHELTVSYFKSRVRDNARMKEEQIERLCGILSSLTDVTIENVRNCVRTLKINKDYLDEIDVQHIEVLENTVLEKLISSIKIEKTTCSICLENTATHQHCTRCLNRDTLVCKGCIVQMLKFAPGKQIIYYECPHCRLLITQPKWTLSNPKALRKIIALQKQFIEWVMESESESESESEEDLTDGELMDSELVDGELGDGELMDGDEHGLFNL